MSPCIVIAGNQTYTLLSVEKMCTILTHVPCKQVGWMVQQSRPPHPHRLFAYEDTFKRILEKLRDESVCPIHKTHPDRHRIETGRGKEGSGRKNPGAVQDRQGNVPQTEAINCVCDALNRTNHLYQSPITALLSHPNSSRTHIWKKLLPIWE